ncbi:MAG: bifunctional homocysteine S-methyltransferase/methylenetetrahydrofolate reductase [Gemmatimonadota bacterium]
MRSLIDDGRVHVFDGAMGTLLYSRGVFVNVCYDELNVGRPDTIRRIHEEYVAAGAEILETNTFGANPVKLSAYGLGDRTEEINEAAAGLALEAAGEHVVVTGAVGPLGIRIEPFGPTSREEARELFGRQIDGLLSGGVHGFVLETFSDLTEIECALAAVKARSDLPVVAQMTVGQDGRTTYGADPGQIARALTDLGVDVVGLNCSVGPAVMLDAIEVMSQATSLPLSAQPNAGLPRTVGDRKMYLASPEYMAQYATRMIDVGVRFVGGCCGTTPDHTRKLRSAIASMQPKHATIRVPTAGRTPEPAAAGKVPLEARSALGRKLARGETVISVEILPPNGWATEDLVGPSRKLKVAGVDTVTILESPRVGSRMSALSAATIVEREVGIETILRYSCRDKNMLGMISDLLGAAASGLHNLLVVSGDLPTMGPYPDSTAVFDIDAIGLTNVIQGLNRGMDPGGNPIGPPTEFVQGVAINQGAVDQSRELTRFGYKVEAGADFAVSQPVFDPEALERFLEAAGQSIPVIAGIWPLLDLRNAEFLANEMPGVRVPERIVDRMRDAEASGKEAALEEGIRIALETVEAVRPLVRGFHVSAPDRRVDVALSVVREAGLRATA